MYISSCAPQTNKKIFIFSSIIVPLRLCAIFFCWRCMLKASARERDKKYHYFIVIIYMCIKIVLQFLMDFTSLHRHYNINILSSHNSPNPLRLALFTISFNSSPLPCDFRFFFFRYNPLMFFFVFIFFSLLLLSDNLSKGHIFHLLAYFDDYSSIRGFTYMYIYVF